VALSYKARKRWALVILLIGLPLYIILAVAIVGLFERPPIWLEFLIYVVLGFLWALPFRRVFQGVGLPDPDASPDEQGPGRDEKAE
jgi:membrane protein implicated in regulation of membrane protease activity